MMALFSLCLSVLMMGWLVAPVISTPIAGGGALVMLATRRMRLNWPLIAAVGLSILFLALSLVWSVHLDVSQERVIKVICLLCGCSILLMAQPVKPGLWLIIPIFIALALILFELYSMAGIQKALTNGEGRRLSAYNKALLIIGLLLPFIGYWLLGNGRRLLLGALLAAYIFVVMHSYSVTAQVMIILGPVLIAVFYLFPRLAALAGLGVYIAYALIVPLFLPFIAGFLMAHFQPWMEVGSIGARLEIASAVVPLIEQKIWLGHGLEIVRMQEGLLGGYTYFPGDTVLHPHNLVVQLWVELGLVAVLAHLCFLVYGVYRLYQNTGRRGFAVAMTSLFLALFVLNVSFGIWQSWLLTSLCLIAFLGRSCLSYRSIPVSSKV